MAEKKTEGAKLKEKLFFDRKNVADSDKCDLKKIMDFAEGYKDFLNQKTERDVVDYIVPILKKKGYKEFQPGKKYKAGEKIFICNRGKAVVMSTIGKKDPSHGVKISVSHIDSPRLDFKPMPLFESGGMAYFKTHYYGGIKRYQWESFPMAIHGVVNLKNGKCVKVVIGEDPKDPVFTVNDLLIHLARDQMQKKGSDVLEGEQLNLLIGCWPYKDKEVSDRVKLNVMKILFDKYGFTEEDLVSAELCAVPAFKAQDVGLDRALIGGYGQDDSVCAYAIAMAELETKNPDYTTVTILADKEETGSGGPTGMKSDFYRQFIEDLIAPYGLAGRDVFKNSICFSCDVDGAYDPNFAEVSEARNATYINKGVAIIKYDGSGGKYSSTDASAELMAFVRKVLDKNDVVWQTGMLGKIGQGGGGTVAGYVANNNIDTIGMGVGVLSMHSPYEIVSKGDLYMLYKAVKSFYEINECRENFKN